MGSSQELQPLNISGLDTSKVRSRSWTVVKVGNTEAESHDHQETVSPCDRTQLKGWGLLSVVTLIFASFAPSVRAMFVVIQDSPPIMAWNFGVSFIGLVISVAHRPFIKEKRSFSKDEVMAGLELGFWCFAGATSNVFGLMYTTATQGAFCVQTTTIIVPLVQGMMGVPIPGPLWVGCGLALAGTYALVRDAGGAGGDRDGAAAAPLEYIILGDCLCFLSAVCYSLFDIRINEASERMDYFNLAFSRMVWFAGLSFIGVFIPFLYDKTYLNSIKYFFNEVTPSTIWVVMGVMLWQGMVIQFLATLLLIPGMAILGPTRAQVLYSFVPLLSAALAWGGLGETLGPAGFLGAALLLAALLAASWAPLPHQRRRSSHNGGKEEEGGRGGQSEAGRSVAPASQAVVPSP